MCVIIHKPSGIILSRRSIEDAVCDNPDGFGLVCLESGAEWKTMDADEAVAILMDLGDGEWIFHARIRTHGEISEDMSHPFDVGGSLRLMHNGMLSCFPSDAKRSDTWYLAQALRLVKPKGRKSFLKMLSSSSRFALIDVGARRVDRIGSWVSNSGAWWSNDCSFSRPTTKFGFSAYGSGRDRWYTWRDQQDDDRWSGIDWQTKAEEIGGEA